MKPISCFQYDCRRIRFRQDRGFQESPPIHSRSHGAQRGRGDGEGQAAAVQPRPGGVRKRQDQQE